MADRCIFILYIRGIMTSQGPSQCLVFLNVKGKLSSLRHCLCFTDGTDRQETEEVVALEGEGQVDGWTILETPAAAPVRAEAADIAGKSMPTLFGVGPAASVLSSSPVSSFQSSLHSASTAYSDSTMKAGCWA